MKVTYNIDSDMLIDEREAKYFKKEAKKTIKELLPDDFEVEVNIMENQIGGGGLVFSDDINEAEKWGYGISIHHALDNMEW